MKKLWRDGWSWWLRYRLFGNPWQAMKDVYWWIVHRTFRKHHLLHLKFLRPGFYHPDTRMIHAMFTILSNFMESKDVLKVNWEATPEHSEAWKEMQALYRWWHGSYLIRREPVLDVPDEHVPDFIEDLSRSQAMYPVWHEAAQATKELEVRWAKEDEENIVRLAKIQKYLFT